jgi:tryptophan 2,3-dioxygenase
VSPPLTYGTYLRIPELLGLQRCRSDPPEHDEPLFIIVHQVYELWFKQLLHEIDSSVRLLGDDRVSQATRLLRRALEILRLLVQQVRILETMRPQDFLAFRSRLNPASGFQSLQFRELEFCLGMKDPEILERLDSPADEVERLRSRLTEPSLGDAVDGILERRGFEGAVVVGGASRPEAWRLRALTQIYTHPDRDAELSALMEVLIEIDESLGLWRYHHVLMVERMIGSKRGTGGSDGAPYLRGTLDKRAFPDLWRVRTELVPASEG